MFKNCKTFKTHHILIPLKYNWHANLYMASLFFLKYATPSFHVVSGNLYFSCIKISQSFIYVDQILTSSYKKFLKIYVNQRLSWNVHVVLENIKVSHHFYYVTREIPILIFPKAFAIFQQIT